MIKRIVKMSFQPDKIDEFLNVFHQARPHILKMQGCNSVELFSEDDMPHIMFTLSEWNNVVALENYRKSELFINTWKRTKVLFAEKAQAWTIKPIKETL